jgi:hypothetical protein
MRVKLSSGIRGVETDTALVEVASDLNVSTSLHELSTGDGASRHDTGAMTWLRTVCNDGGLNITNQSSCGG